MLYKSLAAKLILSIGFLLIVTFAIFAYINVNLQKKYLIEEMQSNGIQLSQTIKKSIEYNMLMARNDQIQKTLEDLGKQEGLENIRIFNKEGKITAADTPEEIGTIIDRKAEACFACHGEDKPLRSLAPRNRTRTFTSDKGHRILGIINPIYNEPRCSSSACHFHPEDQNVLGVMDILVSLDRFDRNIAANRNQILAYFFFVFLAISLCIGLFIFLFVNTPIQKLIEGTRRISQGDLDYQIGAHPPNEIGELSKAFDKMAVNLKKSRSEIESWNIKLEKEVKQATKKLKETNILLEGANKKLKDLDNVKSDFMRKVEHGSRSHLAVIQSSLSLTLKEYAAELDEKLKDLLKTAEQRSKACLECLDDILILSYSKSASEKYRFAAVSLSDLMSEVLGHVQDQLQIKNIGLIVRIPDDLPTTAGDRDALFEAFSNLLNNAVKYTGDNGEIRVSARQKEDLIEIEIADTGIGIASDDQSQIFDEFYRAPNAKSHKIHGTGLGLAIVKEIIKAHSGSIEVQSEPEKGSTFTVLLPREIG